MDITRIPTDLLSQRILRLLWGLLFGALPLARSSPEGREGVSSATTARPR